MKLSQACRQGRAVDLVYELVPLHDTSLTGWPVTAYIIERRAVSNEGPHVQVGPRYPAADRAGAVAALEPVALAVDA